MKYEGISLQNMRKSNMDCILLKEREICGVDTYLVAVCDGVGSLKDGAFASSTAVRLLSFWLDSVETTKCIGLRMLEYANHMNRQIVQMAEEKGLQTASTLSALLICDGYYYIVHVGDSRIYSFSNGVLSRLTQDQTINGKLAACLGRYKETTILYNEGTYCGETFLLCSDGLHKRMPDAEIAAEIVKAHPGNLHQIIEEMSNIVVRQGEKDNVSIAILMKE